MPDDNPPGVPPAPPNQPPADPAPPPTPTPPVSQGRQALIWAWTQLQTARFWLIVLLAGSALFALLVAEPFKTEPVLLTEEEVSTQWNANIARLGIKAVYPPQEDFHVGDVWAIVANAPPGKPVLGKSVRIAQISLKDYILANDEDRPIFQDTPVAAEVGKPIPILGRFQIDVAEADKKRITTSIAAFPAITINHTRKSSSGSSVAWLGLNSSRAGQQYEQVHIKRIETYGAQALEAYGVFLAWCGGEDTKTYCEDDSLARQLLAAAVSPDVLEVDTDGRYTTEIELRLVTRVFMTREIATRRWVVDSSGAAVEIDNDPKGASLPQVQPQAPSPPPASGSTSAPPASTGSTTPQPSTVAARFASQWSNETEIALNAVFQRPVVFGFRSIRHKLPLSQPPKPAPPPVPTPATDASKKAEK